MHAEVTDRELIFAHNMSLTLYGMGSEKSDRYGEGWIPPPFIISIVWRSIETKFGGVQVCHKFYPKR